MSPEEIKAHAEQLQRNPMLWEILRAFRARAINDWVASAADDTDARERAWHSVHAALGLAQTIKEAAEAPERAATAEVPVEAAS